MFFEGSEKKFEIIVKNIELLKIPNQIWEGIVESCNAKILSIVENKSLKAFLLSESSLFVWNDRIVMITCGKTVLVNSIFSFVEYVSKDNVEFLVFQRKNEYYGHLQESSFQEDYARLHGLISGKAYQFGDLDGHHNFLFHMDKSYKPKANDNTSELLMYHISGIAAEALRCGKLDSNNIRRALGIDELFSDFQIDDFVFEPCGYSLNGIKGEDYITVHVTPEEGWSYVSFETSVDLTKDYPGLIEKIVEIMKPKSFDLVTFDMRAKLNLSDKYLKLDHVTQNVGDSYLVEFYHFKKALDGTRAPNRLD